MSAWQASPDGGSWYVPRPCELDDDPLEWHVVKVDQRRIDCAEGCDGPEPHMHEYRALDVNPNR